jgi:predicted AAA+ superfamily ATPase
MYDMRGLSFREFLEYDQGTQFPALALSSILDNSSKLSIEIVERIKPIPAFQDYLRHGYYPFYKEDVRGFHSRLANVANLILESDLPAVESIEVHTIPKIKKLLWLISKSVPFTPNISALSQQVGVSRNSLLNYLSWLERAGLVRLLPLKGGGFNVLAKPEKIYLDNTNFIHAFEPQQPNLGNERETFFFNQVSSVAKVTAAKRGDFLLDDAITVEVGGRNKTPSQLPDASSSYLALDNIEYGSGNRIPLWLFGFLY